MKFLSIALLAFLPAVVKAQSGCTDPAATNYNSSATVNDGSCVYPVTHYAPMLRGELASNISESSGVVWTDGKLWTHNDSGNPAEIYSIDTANGHTLQTVVIDNYPNTDWEDITADSAYIYVGNFGNNSGDRTDLAILKIKKSDITSAATVHVNAQAIAFSYTDQTSFTSSSTHNFDCESVFSLKDSLYIFTKDRGDLSTRVYRLPKTPGTYAVSPYTTYNTNGLVTGADYDAVHNEVMLIGYMSGHTNSFMWVLNDFQGTNFFSGNKRRIEIGNSNEWQTEGICYISNHRYFISCESAGSINASLFVGGQDWQHTTFAPSVAADQIKIYPNPVRDVLVLDEILPNTSLRIYDATGLVVSEGALHTGINTVSVASFAPGTYFAELMCKGQAAQVLKVVKW